MMPLPRRHPIYSPFLEMDFARLLRGIGEARVARIDRPAVRRADAGDLLERRTRYFFVIPRDDPAFFDVAIVSAEAGDVYVGKRFLGEPFALFRRALNDLPSRAYGNAQKTDCISQHENSADLHLIPPDVLHNAKSKSINVN
jgi:hypothetical protein